MVRILMLVIVLGLVAWLLTYLPIPEPFRTIIYILMILCVVWEILAVSGYTRSYLGRPGPLP